eukprot:TRINITY_DN1299_c0_g1_i8.p1 TRINITY_DN1299_c0_g1~~TRINITY_DN1299_c0_g1_i8.p1  ORF type:complete len:412 (-),score=83.57 TRINITY_DN1299_c0_g1_i8:535-1770(-)
MKKKCIHFLISSVRLPPSFVINHQIEERMGESAADAAFELKVPNDPSKAISIPVVQELAKLAQSSHTLPQRYIRDPATLNSPFSLSSFKNSDEDFVGMLPVIDISTILSQEDSDLKLKEVQKLSIACKEWGFFQVINHGIPSTWMERMKKVCKEFFDLPLEEKMKCRQRKDVQGYGQAFVVSDDQPLDWADMLYLQVLPPEMQVQELWPNDPHDFQEVLTGYATQVEKLAKTLMKLMEDTLGLQVETFSESYKTWESKMRINYYPPCPRPDQALGLSPHSDADYLTVLLQDNEVPGLQIKKNDRWLLVQPLQDALTVNVGDYIEVMSNGIYKSIEHRAITNKYKERMSIATFFAPGPGECIEPASQLLDPSNPSIYRRISADDYFKSYLSNRLEGKKGLSDYLTSKGCAAL